LQHDLFGIFSDYLLQFQARVDATVIGFAILHCGYAEARRCDVGRTCDGHAKSSLVRRDGRGGARAPSPPSLLGLGIGVGKGWEVVLNLVRD